MKDCRPHLREYNMAAFFNYFSSDCEARDAYPAICGTGYHGAILHYTKNNAKLEPGQMFLIDAGPEFRGNIYSQSLFRLRI